MNKIPILCTALLVLMVGSAFAEMASNSYKISISVLDTVGTKKESNSFKMLDAVGQPSTIGESTGATLRLESGFLYQTIFSRPLNSVLSDVLIAVTAIEALPNLTKKQGKRVQKIKKSLNKAITAWNDYQGGDPKQLAKALKETKKAIDSLSDLQTSGIDTAAYQEMLALSAQLAVENGINDITLIAGAAAGGVGIAAGTAITDNHILKAWSLFEAGTVELYEPDYEDAVKSFRKAYKAALESIEDDDDNDEKHDDSDKHEKTKKTNKNKKHDDKREVKND